MDSIDYFVKSIAQKLTNLRDNKRLRNSDREMVDEILDTDIPTIQSLLRAKNSTNKSENER